MSVEQTADLPRSHPDAGRERLDRVPFVIQKAIGDQCQGTGDSIRSAAPTCEFRRDLGSAAKAGAEPVGLGMGAAEEESAVRPLGCPCRTDGTAIDSSGNHPDEEASIEAGVAGLEGTVAYFRVE